MTTWISASRDCDRDRDLWLRKSPDLDRDLWLRRSRDLDAELDRNHGLAILRVPSSSCA